MLKTPYGLRLRGYSESPAFARSRPLAGGADAAWGALLGAALGRRPPRDPPSLRHGVSDARPRVHRPRLRRRGRWAFLPGIALALGPALLRTLRLTPRTIWRQGRAPGRPPFALALLYLSSFRARALRAATRDRRGSTRTCCDAGTLRDGPSETRAPPDVLGTPAVPSREVVQIDSQAHNARAQDGARAGKRAGRAGRGVAWDRRSTEEDPGLLDPRSRTLGRLLLALVGPRGGVAQGPLAPLRGLHGRGGHADRAALRGAGPRRSCSRTPSGGISPPDVAGNPDAASRIR